MSEERIVDPATGGAKGQKAERYEQIPAWPLAEIARCYGFGATKYQRANFLRGYAWSLSTDALLRHIHAWRAGERHDPESGLHPLAHAAFHLLALMEFERRGIGTDDRLYDDASVPTGTIAPTPIHVSFTTSELAFRYVERYAPAPDTPSTYCQADGCAGKCSRCEPSAPVVRACSCPVFTEYGTCSHVPKAPPPWP